MADKPIDPRTSRNRSGVYRIFDYRDRSYVGRSQDIPTRWLQHRSDLRRGEHHCIKLQRAWSKYGEGAFQFAILEYGEEHDLRALERYYMELLQPHYNMALSPDGGKAWAYLVPDDVFEERWTRNQRNRLARDLADGRIIVAKPIAADVAWSSRIRPAVVGGRVSPEAMAILYAQDVSTGVMLDYLAAIIEREGVTAMQVLRAADAALSARSLTNEPAA